MYIEQPYGVPSFSFRDDKNDLRAPSKNSQNISFFHIFFLVIYIKHGHYFLSNLNPPVINKGGIFKFRQQACDRKSTISPSHLPPKNSFHKSGLV